MKKILAVLAVTAAFTSPVLADDSFNNSMLMAGPTPSVQISAPKGVLTQRGHITDPDAFIRNSIQRNYGHYQSLNGG